MPGFLGTPAGMATRSQSYSASPSLSAPVALLTCNHHHGLVTSSSSVVSTSPYQPWEQCWDAESSPQQDIS